MAKQTEQIDPPPRSGMDSDARALVETLEALGQPPLESLSPADARVDINATVAALNPAALNCDIEELIAASETGAITLRFYRPVTREHILLPAVLFIHGGGWMLGELDHYDGLCSRIAVGAGVCVVSVRYRRAPEHKFPAAQKDSWAALRWVAVHSEQLGLDSTRLAVCGDSAGGNLAAVTALVARDAGGPALAAQVLLYPVVDLQMRHASYRRNACGFFLTANMMRWFRAHYISDDAQLVDWRASPLLASTHAGLPPTYLVTCGYDPLCDEGADFAGRLDNAHVAVQHVHYPGQIHGFISMGNVIAEADVAIARICGFVRQHLAR
jgi:acetyl esterase